jgi:hypothetical protein
METDGKQQRAKCYRLTIAGKKQLLSEQERWWQMMKAITVIVGACSD